MDFVLERLHKVDNTRIIIAERIRPYTCGRDKDNDIVCLSLLVSRKHCMFSRVNEDLYVTVLRSSNGIFINGERKQSHQMINIRENDIIGIGSPITNLNEIEDRLHIYKVCIIKSPIFDKEQRTLNLSRIILNNNTLQRISVSPVDRILAEKSTSNSDMLILTKERKGINSDLSRDDQRPHSSTSNNLETKYDPIDISAISAEDNIEIINAPLEKKAKKEDTMDYNVKSAKCLNSVKHVRKISKSSDKQNDELYFTKNPNIVHTDDQDIKYEDELQITDDEEAHVECDTPHDESSIKLKKTKHEPKTRLSLIDVVDLSDDEEGISPYSQLFGIKYEDNTKNREIKPECVNDDDLNIEKYWRLNVDDFNLTDSEDEDNPWLERLSRNQLLNEDIKACFT